MRMLVKCPCCDRKMQAELKAVGRRVRCLACARKFRVAERVWFYRELGHEHGPVCPRVLLELAQRRDIGPETLLRKGMTGRWLPASRLRGLFHGSSKRPALAGRDDSTELAPAPWVHAM